MATNLWIAAILERLALSPDAPLILALDPDGLLLEEDVMCALREAEVNLLTLNPDDPFQFRYLYESEYRTRWDKGERPRLLVRLAGGDANGFPYDLLARAGGREKVRSLSLARFFPLLAYPPLQDLACYHRAALARLYERYQAAPPPGQLGAGKTREYLLQQVYDVGPETIRSPADLVRFLLRCHRRKERPAPFLEDTLLGWWQSRPDLAGLPLGDFLRDEGALLRRLDALWPVYLERKGFPVRPEELPSDLALLPAFDDPEVQALLDILFLEGHLRPARLAGPWPVSGWIRAGVFFDEEGYRRERFHRLTLELKSQLATVSRDRDWLAFAPSWAEVLRLRHQVDLPSEEEQRFEQLHDQVEDKFAEWLRQQYGALAGALPIPKPTMGHHVAEALAYHYRQSGQRIALIVVDGLAWDQWLVLRDALPISPLSESGLFAWIPTVTAVARQALFAGREPSWFADTWHRTDVDARRWADFWQEQRLPAEAVLYLQDPSLSEIEERVSDPRLRVLGIVLSQVDRMAHQQEDLGELHRVLQSWIVDRQRGPAPLFACLQKAGFACWLTSDHGNIQARGIGRPREGVLVERTGLRVRIYTDERLLQRARDRVPEALCWTPEGLPEPLRLLLAPGRKAFARRNSVAICHGGVALEEVVVPFVRLF